ncbi:NADH dehydrogenase [ubiquinone] 1 alpha subcomplex subunit 2-like [Physella acuta]|uniref:NADH dehydrogenase [ubiquinone] 1 alpha subcomplex subunit 2-like n=1 Tax=Physella acuta TaxID=109671 RepID=UPI0027DC766E|nr:NADH dehydrogenase [ubiquinone] 1 alpha subcomplex subunit 2-like [Physella acuta]
MASAAAKIGSHLKELRFHLCLKSASSKGVREYIESSYVNLKVQNPKFPFLVREADNIQPKIYARYALGKESSLPLTNMTKDQVARAVESLISRTH